MEWKEKMVNGKIVWFGQDENGMHWGVIRSADGELESATTKKTSAEVW